MTAIFHEPLEHALAPVENFNLGVVANPVQASGMRPCVDGFCLPSGGEGSLIYSLSIPADTPLGSRLCLLLWFYAPPGGTNAVDVSTDNGASFRTVGRNTTWAGQKLFTDVRIRPATSLVLRFTATNPTGGEALVVDRLVVLSSRRTGGPAREIPNFADRRTFFFAFLLIGLVAVPLSRSPWQTLVAVTILAFAAAVRLAELGTVMDLHVEPDAQGYRAMAAHMKLFTDTGFFAGIWAQREPLFILAVKIFFYFAGNSDYHLRLFSYLMSIASVAVMIWAGTRWFGPILGAFCGGVFALSVPLWIESARGLRLEFEFVLLVIYLMLCFGSAIREGWPKTIMVGLYGGVLVLLRTTYLPFVMVANTVLAAHVAGTPRKFLIRLTVLALLTIGLVVPHRYNMYRHTGDPFYDTSLYARWNANVEFSGQPGYHGPKLSYFDYTFKLHTVPELVGGTLRGFAKLYAHMNVRTERVDPLNIALQFCAAVGFVLALWDRRFWWLPVSLLAMELPIAFLYDRALLEPFRHTMPAFPLVAFAAAYALQRLALAVVDRGFGSMHHRECGECLLTSRSQRGDGGGNVTTRDSSL